MSISIETLNHLSNANDLEFITGLHKKVFSSKDIPLTNRVINHWHDNDLFLYKGEPGQWRRFSVADYVWVLLCSKLRAWNVGLQTIRKVRDQCIASSFEFFQHLVIGEIKKLEPGVVPKELEPVIGLFKDTEELKKGFAEPEFQMFSWWLFFTLQQGVDVLLRVKPDEKNTTDFVLLKKNKVDAEKLLMEIAEEGGLFISLQSLLNEFYQERRFKWEEVVSFGFSSHEKKIVGLLREKGYKTVTVHFKKEKMSHIKLEEAPQTMSSSDFNTHVLTGKFKNIEVLTQDGDTLVVKTTHTVKL